jgi:cysteine-dependent adenosine diphosphate thiazole synthase
VKRLQKLGMVHSAPGMGALDMNSAEDMVVAHTREVVPGMVICGMEVCCRPLLVWCNQCSCRWPIQWFDRCCTVATCGFAVKQGFESEVVGGGTMQVAELDGAPRMGPTFGAMFISGQKAAHCALNSLQR